jgi:hypothetical protein
MTSISLAVPHTPWIPARVESMQRVREFTGGWPWAFRVFDERATNKEWPRTMWRWLVSTDSEWCLTVQDDTLAPAYFRHALLAMLPHVGANAVLGLSAVHPIGPEIARQGGRWYRTRSWCVGWGYAMRRNDLAEFLMWMGARPQLVATCNEDDLLNRWVGETGRTTWHPVPSILDHDTSIESTYENDSHVHRRSTVTWRDYQSGSLTDRDFWLPSGEPPLLPVPSPHHCWFCMTRPAQAASHLTGARLCRHCWAQVAAQLIAGTT